MGCSPALETRISTVVGMGAAAMAMVVVVIMALVVTAVRHHAGGGEKGLENEAAQVECVIH